ncbi:flagellin [Alteromonas sp. MB-3u-76]|uniref:flagellin N-terminal helical domain-containing protein n=1 Tax=Alteromonas sp. MB-3u-76 TaxID=2058133 RepID=UPI000C3176BB|nr:flagellin [Alteromonas sp. MB-3u-76]AUC89434.1 flagellin [Alteromonas sp. MB-3u-76]
MSLFVNTNISSLTAQRNLFSSSMQLDKSFERLSSGFRINSASDDAAGLQISDRLSSQINGLNQAVRNANDAISVTQTADGALSETVGNLQRLRQLAIQSQNGINSLADKTALQKEAQELVEEINRISTDTQFAGQNLLDGTYSAAFLVGANAGQTITVSLTQFSAAGFGPQGALIPNPNLISGTSGYVKPENVSGAADLQTTGGLGFIIDDDRLAFADNRVYNLAVSYDGGNSYSEISLNLTDPGFGLEEFASALNEAGGGNLWSASSTDVSPTGSINDFRIAAPDQKTIDELFPNPIFFRNEVGIYKSEDILQAIDGAISRFGSVRSELGALQNRFQSTIRNLSITSENLSASRSRINDTDYAKETANLARNQIIQQASNTILAQANQRPQLALSLLS